MLLMLFGFFVLGLNVDSPMADFRYIMFIIHLPYSLKYVNCKKTVDLDRPPLLTSRASRPPLMSFCNSSIFAIAPTDAGGAVKQNFTLSFAQQENARGSSYRDFYNRK